MFKKINFQFLISYTGLLPFLIILLDKLFFNFLNNNIVSDFLIFYSLIIFVFIGAVNWNLKKNISFFLILLGFMPSFISVFVIIMTLYSYEVTVYIVLLFVIQLILDYFNYKEDKHRAIYFKLRVPLTLVIIFCLIFIQL